MAFAYDLIWQSAPPVSFYKNQTVLSLFKPTTKNCAQPNKWFFKMETQLKNRSSIENKKISSVLGSFIFVWSFMAISPLH